MLMAEEKKIRCNRKQNKKGNIHMKYFFHFHFHFLFHTKKKLKKKNTMIYIFKLKRIFLEEENGLFHSCKREKKKKFNVF